MKKIFLCIVAVFLFQTLVVKSSEAIPVFARKYRTSCSTCHIAIFKRNAFGEAFRKNGYRIPGDDSFFVKEEPVRLGAEAWKRKFPDSIWPGTLPQTVPIGFYGHMRAVWEEDDTTARFTFDLPHELEMLLGGVFEEKISFFGTWLVFEEGHVDLGRLGELWLQFNDVFTEDIFNVRVGRWEPKAIESFREDNRLTLAHYKTNDFKDINGKFRLRQPQGGIEINGIVADRLDYAFAVVNGNGSASVLDDNDSKDIYYRVAYKFGGLSLTGTGGEGDEGETLSTNENWRDDSIQVAHFGYLGYSDFGDGSGEHGFQRLGFDFRALYSRFELGAAYVRGTDENLLVSGVTGDVVSDVYFVEGQAMIFPWMFTVIRYENEKQEQRSATLTEVDNLVVNLTMLQRANIRWTLEGVKFLDESDGKHDTLKLNLLFAF